MDTEMRKDAERIVAASIDAVLPDEAVARALSGFRPGPGRTVLVAAGKAAWQMAKAALETLSGAEARLEDAAAGRGASAGPGARSGVDAGVVVTKYGHVLGEIPGLVCFEAGHPVPDENSYAATRQALEAVRGLTDEDSVIFLLSGGASALFEAPLVAPEEIEDITRQLLACGADIVETNTIRKRLSGVKGGRFAQACAPARVFSVVLSDIIGDPLDMIGSGPAYPDASTSAEALAIADRYALELSAQARGLLAQETPKELDNVTTTVTGSVRELCAAADAACRELGYEPTILTDQLACEASEAGAFLGAIARTQARELASAGQPADAGEGAGEAAQSGANADQTAQPGANAGRAFIAGGETVVHLKGAGLGGRNQEIALAAAPLIAGLAKTAVFSVGSDGTDGPTDAAGGYVDGESMAAMAAAGWDAALALEDNDAYHALASAGGLIVTGPTGTNVNDVAVVLVGRG